MTDADLVRRLDLRSQVGFARRLAETRHVTNVAGASLPLEAPTLWPASSRRVAHVEGLPLLCVGDAASCYDPVAGQGILKALQSGIFASYAIADALRGADERGLQRYAFLVERDFEVYCAAHRAFHALEPRWRTRPFWCRRQEDRKKDRQEGRQDDRTMPVTNLAEHAQAGGAT